MSRVLYRCMTCFEWGNQRDYHTVSGFKSHLANYHGAKPHDLVNVYRKGAENDGGNDAGKSERNDH